MSDRNDFEEHQLPDYLRVLDEELSSISYEERPSFGPELRAELAGAWTNQRPEPSDGLPSFGGRRAGGTPRRGGGGPVGTGIAGPPLRRSES